MDEIIVLLKYIERIMKEKINGRKVRQEDIGIISPYKKQVIFTVYLFKTNIYNFEYRFSATKLKINLKQRV